ncbi:endospore germination permease [Fictibacillus nanhaiensis]|uniref:Endospore germination permease n=1 Tax=Fictibacillus nanhaiensis TaxID=742169 RepID=A0ABS2ZW77_9BACL|nr:endospore germination permease [Fictibacillus nanhaiensis]
MNHTINRWQLVLIVISFIMGSSLLMAPNLTAFFSGQDAWISMLFAVIIGLVLNVIWILLLKRYHFRSIFRITEVAGGKVVGTILNIVIIFYALHLASYVVRNLSNFMISNVIPESSPWTFQIMIILLAVYSCFYGLNNIGRVNEFLTPFMILFFICSLALTTNQFRFSHLQPYFEQGFLKISQGAYTTTGFPFIEIILLGSVLTYVKNKDKLSKSYLAGILLGGSALILTVFIAVGVEGAYMVKRQSYPTYELMRDISIINIFERVEVIIGVVWIFGILVKIVICLFTALKGLQHLSKSSNYHPFLLPAGLLIWAMSNHIHNNTMEFTDFVGRNWTLWWFTLYMIVLLVLSLGILRKKDKSIDPHTEDTFQ